MSAIDTPSVFGLDIGGANLKAAHTNGQAHTCSFALWREPNRLAEKLAALLQAMPAADILAVTMTAELCDCYASKSAGVQAILQAVEQTASSLPIRIWTIRGKFQSIAEIRSQPLLAAAANWLALATYSGRFVPQSTALLMDCGTTTTDIIPLISGIPTPMGWNDLDRLTYGELVYTGIERTPICAVLQKAVWRGREVRMASELFATTLDAYLVLGNIPPEESNRHTADGRPRTLPCAHARLARMVCADTDEFDRNDAVELARQIRAAQIAQVQDALRAVRFRLPSLPANEAILVSGSGAFLAKAALKQDTQVVSLSEKIGSALSEVSAAYAVAVLASEML